MASNNRHSVPAGSDPLDRYRKLLDSLGEACMALDSDGLIAYCNPAFATLVGIPEEKLTGQPLPWVRESPFYEACMRAVVTPVSQEAEETFDGRLYHLRVFPAPGGAIVLLSEIPARHRLDEDLTEMAIEVQQAQRLVNLGSLAGGIAHEFNNILVGILGGADLLLRELRTDAPERSFAEMIKKSAERAAHLTRQMLRYGGKNSPKREPLDLNHLISENLPLLKAGLSGQRVRIDLYLADNLPALHADAAQIQQVVVSLLLNAAESGAGRPNRISLTTGLQGPDSDIAYNIDALCPSSNDFVFLEVADQGCGMPPDVLARLFDPPFKIKATGRGLGLAAVKGIVHAHQGAIRATSEPGHGTTVRVLLPFGTAE